MLLPEIRELHERIVRSGRAPVSARTPTDARALMRAGTTALGPGPAVHEVRCLSIPTERGVVQARLYLPSRNCEGLVVYLHGGGWVLGDLDDFDALARCLASRSRCAVLMPAYRLAPEHRFPEGLEDAENVIAWASTEMVDLLGSRVPLVTAGDSAGGNLATGAAWRQHRQHAIAGQVLLYPVTDCGMDTPSYSEYADAVSISRKDMEWFFHHYVGAELRSDPRVSPLRIPDLRGLPPSVIVTAECDVLRDEGEAYAERLRVSGNRVTLRRMPGLPHGFARLHNLFTAADEALAVVCEDIAGLCRTAAHACNAEEQT